MAAGIGPVRFQRLLEVCGGAEAAWHASDSQLATAGLEHRTAASLKRLRRQTTPSAAYDHLRGLGVEAVTLEDAGYPEHLRTIPDPPPVLFVKGRLLPRDHLAVALVGTRQATAYGRAVALRLGGELATSGVTVVSGMARGIDSVAHRAALEAGGRTIGVLANGLDQVYPPENTALVERIVSQEAGAVVSEFPPGVPPDAANFPRRNRLIAGLSRVTVIVEAGQHSGALITADNALEQGREVMAVPGSILSATSAGSNELLKQGAVPVLGVHDILAVLDSPDLSASAGDVARPMPHVSELEKRVLEALSGEPLHKNDIARETHARIEDVSVALTMLEMKGMARPVGALYTRS